MINSLIKPFHPHTPQFYTHDSFYLSDHQQDWVTGAYMLIRKPILDKSGYFDENYFMYGEEYELSYRLKKLDPTGQTWYLVGPQIIHYGGASSPTRSAPLFLEYQGVLAFFSKHKTKFEYNLVKVFININRIFRIIIFTLLGRPQVAKLYQQHV
jgi:GT2 family glycosyltransferase